MINKHSIKRVNGSWKVFYSILFFSRLVARQVKTIQYALSSVKCMQDGWTVRPKTPPVQPLRREDDEFSIDVNTSLLQVSQFTIRSRSLSHAERYILIIYFCVQFIELWRSLNLVFSKKPNPFTTKITFSFKSDFEDFTSLE